MSLDGSPGPQQQEMQDIPAAGDSTLQSEVAFRLANDEEEAIRPWGVDDDLKTDLMALVVLDDISHEVCF